MEYNIFVYEVENIDSILEPIDGNFSREEYNYPKFLEVHKFDCSILQINVGNKRISFNDPDNKKFLQFIEKFRGSKAVVKLVHPEATQTNFGLGEGEYIFSEELFPPIFIEDNQKIIDTIKGITTREEYFSVSEYCSYFPKLSQWIYHSIINRGLFYEFKDLIPASFIKDQVIAYVLDDPDLYEGTRDLDTRFCCALRHNSVNLMTKFLEEDPSNDPIFLPLSENMSLLLENYNVPKTEGSFRDNSIMRAIYSNNLDALREHLDTSDYHEIYKLRMAVYDFRMTIYNLRTTIYNHTSPEFVELCREKLSSDRQRISREMFF